MNAVVLLHANLALLRHQELDVYRRSDVILPSYFAHLLTRGLRNLLT